MKKAIFSLAAIFMLAFVSATYAQDDLYYNPSDDYFQEEVAEVEETVQEERRSTARTANANDCSYCYTSRIRRFRNNYRGFNYYDPCYTDGYYYNTASAGTNIYLISGSPYSYYNSWSRPNSWATWNSPYAFGSAYNQYYNTWSNPYSYGNYYGYGNNYGYSNYGGYGGYGSAAAYCPPNAYGGGSGGYYADSTPGNTNTAPRGVRTSNYSNPTADTRGGSGRSGSNPDGGGKITPTRNNTASSANTTSATRRTTRNNTPAASSSTRSTRRTTTTTPSASTRSNKRTSRFGSMMNSGSRNSSSTRSSRSNSSYKPSSTRSSSSRSNSSFRSSGSSSKSSSTRSSSSRGGRGGK